MKTFARLGFAFGLLAGLPAATAAQAASESVLYSFTQASGFYPYGDIVRVGGDVYGTLQFSPAATGGGAVYRLTKTGGYKIVHNFSAPPYVNLLPNTLIDVAGTLYGTTILDPTGHSCGGGNSCGMIYSVTPSGVYNVLYTFQGEADGFQPASLTYLNGAFYGTTIQGGSGRCHCGTVFSLTPEGVFKTLYSFQGGLDGAYPDGGLISVEGRLYGVTDIGGGMGCRNQGCGTIYSISVQGAESVLYAFKNKKNDGFQPTGKLLNLGGALYGVTYEGGISDAGTVFRVTLTGHHETLHDFELSGTDGAYPFSGLTNIGGTLYGTTEAGGVNRDGTVYSISTHGDETVVHAFNGADGYAPLGPLISSHGRLYGTAGGGSANDGVVFEVTP